MSFEGPAFQDSPLVGFVMSGTVGGYLLEKIIGMISERIYPDDQRKASIAEMSAVAVIDALMLFGGIALVNNGYDQLVLAIAPIAGPFTISLSAFAASNCTESSQVTDTEA